MTNPPENALLPCRKCGELDFDMWNGLGTQAELSCNNCGQSEGVQVIDLIEYEERYAVGNEFNNDTLKYPESFIAKAKARLIEEWNIRAQPPALPDAPARGGDVAAVGYECVCGHRWNGEESDQSCPACNPSLVVAEAIVWATAVKEQADIRISGEEFHADDHAKSKHLGSLIQSSQREVTGEVVDAVATLERHLRDCDYQSVRLDTGTVRTCFYTMKKAIISGKEE